MRFLFSKNEQWADLWSKANEISENTSLGIVVALGTSSLDNIEFLHLYRFIKELKGFTEACTKNSTENGVCMREEPLLFISQLWYVIEEERKRRCLSDDLS